MHHAYLFYGPSQVGKYTFANLLAKTFVCGGGGFRSARLQPRQSDPKGSHYSIPCGSCRACVAFAHGVHPDVSILSPEEGGSISIEGARQFIHTLATKPLLSSLRIGIIEQAGELTVEAGNALLKTIEEPGLQVRLILTAHTPILPTIASRCQRIQFYVVPDQEMSIPFQGVSFGSEVIQAAQGRPGRAIQLSEQEAFIEYQEAVRDIEHLLTKDEGQRLIWVSEQFGGRGEMVERREGCRSFLQTLQEVVRRRLLQEPQCAQILKRSLEAEQYIRGNVDPRLAAEYVLLNYES